jgi:dihydrofolate synthase/folylpolyglutamate synthase
MFMTSAESVDYLLSLQASGIKLGLETMERLCARLGHPERTFPSVHIAGTNGKGSVAALVEAGLRASGYRTGLYTSPHLVRFSERIRVGGREIPEADLVERVGRIRAFVESLERQGVKPTFFEATTALAFDRFRAERVAIAVVETGLGGRLDSTNVLLPQVTAITGIGFDHMEYLGHTLEAIAAEKAGILKPGVPVVLGRLPAEARGVIEARAREIGAPLWESEPPGEVAWDASALVQHFRWRGSRYAIRLPGGHQADNAVVALEVLRVLAGRGWELRGDAVRRSFAQTVWPARFEILSTEPWLVLDGGHNPDGVRRALETWFDCRGQPPGRIVFGCMKDKNVSAMLEPLVASGAELVFVPVSSPRSAEPQALAEAVPPGVAVSVRSVEAAFQWQQTTPDPRGTLVLGSLYLAGEWMALRSRQPHQLALN